MKLSGTRQLSARREAVWRKLNDPAVLQRCIPGCESLTKTGDNTLAATVAVSIGPISTRFNGEVTLSELNPPTSYRIAGQGKGGPAGMASGGADVRLEPKDGGTLLAYDVDAKVSGKIAQLGGRLIDATAAKLAGEFFDAFAREVEGPVAGAAGRPSVPAPRTGAPIWIWWLAAAIAAAVALYYLLK